MVLSGRTNRVKISFHWSANVFITFCEQMKQTAKRWKKCYSRKRQQTRCAFFLALVPMVCPMELISSDRAALFAYFGGCWIDPSLYSHSTNTLVDCLRCEHWVASCLGSLIKIQLSFWFLEENGGTLGKKRMLHFLFFYPSSPLPICSGAESPLCQFTHTYTPKSKRHYLHRADTFQDTQNAFEF